MSKFTNYSEIEGVDVVANEDTTNDTTPADKVAKLLKKNNNLMKRLIKLEERRMAAEAQQKKSGFWGFLKKVEKVFTKTLPRLLNTLVSKVVDGIYKVKVAEVKAVKAS